MPQTNPPSGLKLIIDNSWPDLPGYRLVRLEFLSNQPAAEERRLRVQIKFHNSNYTTTEITVTTDEIVLPAGQSAVKYQLYYPNQGHERIHEVRTTEDDETWPDLSCKIYTGQSNSKTLAYLDLTGLQFNTVTATPSLNIQGVVGVSAAPGYVNQSETHEYRKGDRFSYPMNMGWSGIRNYAELPNNPLGYDCFKVVFCRPEQLKTLRANYPVQWAALRNWVAMGGKLLVLPAENNNPESTRQTQLKLDSLFPQGEASSTETPHASWNTQKLNSVAEPLQFQQDEYYEYNGYPRPMPSVPPSMGTQFGVNDGTAFFDFPAREWFQGTLAVLPDAQRIEPIYAYLHNATQQPLPATALPTVGLPPITMFQILITLFVILIGPVNYFYFKKKKRMNWLLITVPAGALLITVLLLGYTLFKDGIGVRTWSQSFTILDQTQKVAATQHQFCLFAGITPGEGLRFGETVDFKDLSTKRGFNYNYRYRDGRNWDYAWDQAEDGNSGIAKQHLRSGWLPARTLKLFETREFAPCQRELKITMTGETCQLENKLGTKILRVYVADGKQVWNHADIAAEETVTASLLGKDKAINLRPTLVHDLNTPASEFEASGELSLPPQDQTILERFLGQRKLHPRVYLAIVENWPELQAGIASPSVEPWGPHIILGVW